MTLIDRVKYLRSAYGSRPWRAELDGQPLSGLPMRVDHPQLGETVIMGTRCWRTRREAQQAIQAMLEAVGADPSA